VAQRKLRFPEETYTVREPAVFLALDEKLAKLTPAQLAQYREAQKLYAKGRANPNFQQALTEMAAAATSFKATVGEKGPNYANCLEWQARLQYATGKTPAALATLEQGRALLVELYGDSPMLAANLRTTTQYLQAIGKSPEAIQLQRQIVALYERLLKNVTVAKELALARSQLGEALLFTGDLSAASELILDARSVLLPFRASAPAHYRENLGHLVLLNLQAGNPQQALPDDLF
jgi:tetratricopeptide (TPR) repeat protein